jgi:hypothetical protein
LLGSTAKAENKWHAKDRSLSNGLYKKAESRVSRILEKSWPIGEQLKNDNAEDLFAWVGQCIAEVVQDGQKPGDAVDAAINMGVTFSFPMM